jgi:hypothetical protein
VGLADGDLSHFNNLLLLGGKRWRKAFLQAVFCGYFPLGLEHKMNYGIFLSTKKTNNQPKKRP